MAALPFQTVIALLGVTLSAIPLTRLFQWWSPPSEAVFLGALSILFILPLSVWLLAGSSCPRNLLHLAMFFSIFMFASAIDLVLSLENDGVISNYMLFYLKKGEPYLATAYSTAICYWDGVVHYVLYWAMLYDYSKGNACFRSLSLYWFGTFFISVVILMLGSISGPHAVYTPILLNVPYAVLPVLFLCWLLTSTKHHRKDSVAFSVNTSTIIPRVAFTLFFIAAIGLGLLRGLVALSPNRDVLTYYGGRVEQSIFHPDNYGRITVLTYMFYGVPFYIYAILCLSRNKNTPALVDTSMMYAGAAANAQVGYLGQYIVTSREHSLSFDDDLTYLTFWISNLLMFVVPQLFAVYCYNSCISKRKQK